ncbi:MAG: glutaredoxin domain-containing protein [bacterium]|nr:glutaredoxin domain-containing protein [bacterium]
MNIKIYSTPTCAYCHAEKEFLREHNIEFQDLDVFSDAKAREEMIQKTGQLGVPVTDIDGKIIIGFDRAKISQLLGLK